MYLAAADRTVDACEILTGAGVPVFRGVAAALRAIGTLALPQTLEATADAPRGVAPDREQLTVLSEADGRALFEEVGVACPASILANSAADAAQAARALGGTVVLKAQSADVLHKTDVGAVTLGVHPDDADAEYDALVDRVRRAVPSAVLEGVLVQEQVSPGVELLVGVQGGRDGYRAVLTVGIGGTAVEIYGDIATALAPVDASRALELLRSLRGWPLLEGFRGARRSTWTPPRSAIAGISRLCDRLGDALVDLEVNPLIVHADGVHAVDFVCRLRTQDSLHRDLRPAQVEEQ